ncbi:hypothetical protein E2C01_031836 [Portunus trituberculatus]|uniref:Uncharacterized protein n=1 Tax=Portunus trituberculatus TaxID=210409 RepID=A0A5B7EUH2_PORTR|nr:hypothetical protein [Portunus trituberculatus]
MDGRRSEAARQCIAACGGCVLCIYCVSAVSTTLCCVFCVVQWSGDSAAGDAACGGVLHCLVQRVRGRSEPRVVVHAGSGCRVLHSPLIAVRGGNEVRRRAPHRHPSAQVSSVHLWYYQGLRSAVVGRE